MTVGALPLPMMTEDVSAHASGTCGDNLTWSITDEVLAISGTGAMNDYNDWDNRSPWQDEFFTNVVIGDGVTSIGDSAFYYCDSLRTITIPDSVTSIGNWAFVGCHYLTIYTTENSTAHKFSTEYMIPVKIINNEVNQ